jgi:hypothetical protein
MSPSSGRRINFQPLRANPPKKGDLGHPATNTRPASQIAEFRRLQRLQRLSRAASPAKTYAMSTKPRADSKLKTLPAALQEEIFNLCQTLGYAAVRSAVKSKFKLDTSEAALSAFWRWYPTARRLEEAASAADEVKQLLKDLPELNLSDDQVSRAGQAVFEASALQRGDVDAYVALRKLRQKDKAHELADRRIKLLEQQAAKADAAEKVVNDGNLTEAERAARIREIFRM